MVIGCVIYGIIYVVNGIQASWASAKESYVTLILFMIALLIHLTVSRRKDWRYLIPVFLSRHQRGLIMRTIWRLHVGVCSRRSLLKCAISYSDSLTLLRGFVKVAGASSFGKAENNTTESSHDPLKIRRVASDSSSTTSQEKTKKGIFRKRK